MRSPPPRAPILIGVTGSRYFDRLDAGRDGQLAAEFKKRMAECCRFLDKHFPQTPKVLLCGAAFGADLLAAQAALSGDCRWSVAALLPFGRELFEQDFSASEDDLAKRWVAYRAAHPGAPEDHEAWRKAWTDRYATHRADLEALLGSARTVVRVMPPLSIHDVPGNDVPATDAQLSRDSQNYDRALRHHHYEQVGQWIAESSTVLFATMPSAKAEVSKTANGGTARIVQHRRVGRPDTAGAEVARRSTVLRKEWSDILRSYGRDVWLVRLDKPPRRRDGLPIDILSRLPAYDDDTEQIGRDVQALPLETLLVPRLIEDIHARAHHLEAKSACKRDRLEDPSWLEDKLHAWKVRRTGWWNARTRPDPVATPTPRAQDGLTELRTRLNVAVGHAKWRSEWAFLTLAALFVLSVALFEIFAKIYPDHDGVLALYLALVAASGWIVSFVRRHRWQPIYEDARAVSEMLRVQMVWWAAGVSRRVDREHLQGVGRDLAHIPETATTFIAWSLFRNEWPGRVLGADALPCDWGAVRGTARYARPAETKGRCDDWIGGQWQYFTKKIDTLDEKAHRDQARYLFCFILAFWLAAIVAFWMVAEWSLSTSESLAEHLKCFDLAAVAGFLVLALVPAWWRLRRQRIRKELREAAPDRRDPAKWTVALLPPLVSAVLLSIAIVCFKPFAVAHSSHLCEVGEHATRYLALVTVAILIALSGALRFITEKFGYEAEAVEYRDALRRFRLAEQELAVGLDAHGVPTAAREEDARRVVKELGKLALDENEAWLKSRRERPLATVG